MAGTSNRLSRHEDTLPVLQFPIDQKLNTGLEDSDDQASTASDQI